MSEGLCPVKDDVKEIQEKARQLGRDTVEAFRQQKKLAREEHVRASDGYKALWKFIKRYVSQAVRRPSLLLVWGAPWHRRGGASRMVVSTWNARRGSAKTPRTRLPAPIP